jgi:hypothetical protein
MLAQRGQRTLVEAGVAYRVEIVRGWVNRAAGQRGGWCGRYLRERRAGWCVMLKAAQ